MSYIILEAKTTTHLTKKLSKGGVLHKVKTPSLARLNHFYLRKALLGLEKEP
jgi:hypothetical protein